MTTQTASLGTTPTGAAADPFDASRARKRISLPRIITTLLVLIFSAWIVWFFATNPRLEWSVAGHYLFNAEVLAGLRTTLIISCVAQAIGMVLGVVFATFRLSTLASLRVVGLVYVTIFRSIPTMVQLVFWFDIAYLIPNLSISLPFGVGPHYGHWSTNTVVTPWIAGVLALSLVQGAYMTEITRAGILSVGTGQYDAARSLGYTSGQTFWRVVLPQAIRVIIPPTGSQFITVVHGSALLSAISVSDLLFSVQRIYQNNYKIVPLLLVAVLWYLVVVLILTYFQQRLERRYSRGQSRGQSRRQYRTAAARNLTARWSR